MPPRTRNQAQNKPQRKGLYADDDYVDEQQAINMLYDDDEEESDEEGASQPSQQEPSEEEQKARPRRKKGNSQQDQNQDEPAAKEREEVPYDPLLHIVEHILNDKDNQYYVKFKGLSYRKAEWVGEEKFFTQQCIQKLKRYKKNKEKAIPLLLEEDDFDKNYLEVDKVIQSTNLFPIIHPRQAKNVNDTWRERCIDILQLIVNYEYRQHCFGVPFLFLRTEERNTMDFTTINNKLYTINAPSPAAGAGQQSAAQQTQQQQQQQQQQKAAGSCYTSPKQFWIDLGSVFKDQMNANYAGTKQRIFIEVLRELAARLYRSWHHLLRGPKNTSIIDHIQELVNLYQDRLEKSKTGPKDVASLSAIIERLQFAVSILKEKNQKDPTICNQSIIQNSNYLMSQCHHTNHDHTKVQSYVSALKQQLETVNQIVDIDAKPSYIRNGEEYVYMTEEDFTWLLEKDEEVEEVMFNDHFTQEQVDQLFENSKQNIDPLYYVKWKNLSYMDCTWEHLSTIKDFDSKLKDFERFNRSLDNNQRPKLMGFGYAHKQLLKLFLKKAQQGKRVDQKMAEETQTREMLQKLLKFESKVISNGYFQYDFEKQLVPQFRNGQKLKDYQISGLNWLLRAWHDNRNVVLADEMGLGKTIMAISLLDHFFKFCKIRGPFLVIAPLSTLGHWKEVAEEWTYLNVIVYHDSKGWDGRQEIIKQDWYYTDVTNKGTITQKSKLPKFNLLITSYEVFNQDLQEVLKEVPFLYVIVDEAHRLKNKQAKTLMLLKEHPCRSILLMTGTPIQNNTKELFTLLNYIEQDTFNSFDKFMAEYGKLETAEQIEKLHQMLKPYFLRRMKDEVDFTIPPLKETVINVGLTSLQQQYYKGIYGENLSTLASIGSASMKTSIFNNIDIQLRKCCNHLYLLKGVEEELIKDLKTEQDCLNKILDSSGKMILLDKFIEKYKQEGHKILIFSQFKGMIEILKEYLGYKQIKFEQLHGSIKSSDRGTSITRFNEDDEFGVFLLTTRAGGLGINLTKARVVIIFDSDWNPQNDLQAIARAHRIGQLFEVSVYRFITDGTYEQQMFDRASRKLGMEQALFQKGAFGDKDQDGVSRDQKIPPAEIEKLLKYGAYAFLDEDGECTNQNNLNIEEILSKGSSKKDSHQKKGSYTLAKSSFHVDGKSSSSKKPKIDDPNFWQKVLPFEGFNPKQLMRKFRSKKNDILESKATQSAFLKDINKCVKDLIEAKQVNDQMVIDEDIYELLKKVSKTKQFETKYRDKATVLLNKLIHINEYQSTIIRDEDGQQEEVLGKRNLKRTAKEKKVEYNENKKRDRKGKAKHSQDSYGYEDEEEDEEEEEEVEKPPRKKQKGVEEVEEAESFRNDLEEEDIEFSNQDEGEAKKSGQQIVIPMEEQKYEEEKKEQKADKKKKKKKKARN